MCGEKSLITNELRNDLLLWEQDVVSSNLAVPTTSFLCGKSHSGYQNRDSVLTQWGEDA